MGLRSVAEVGVSDTRTRWVDLVPSWDDDATDGPEVVIELIDGAERPDAGRGPRSERIWSRVLGWVAIAVGTVGILLGAALVWIGLGVVDRAATTLDDGLGIADDTLVAILDTLDVADATIATTADSLLEMQVSLGAVRGSMNRVDGLLGETADIVGGEIAPSLDSLLAALPGLIDVGDTLDRTLRSLSFLGVPYDPDQPIAEGFREMETALGPVPGRLRAQGDLLAEMRTDLASTGDSLERVRGDVADIRVELEATSVLIGRYRDSASDGTVLVADIRRQVEDGAPVARFALVALGAFFVLYQVFPMWLGWRLVRGRPIGSA